MQINNIEIVKTRETLLGLPICESLTLERIPSVLTEGIKNEECVIYSFINPYCYKIAKENKTYKELLFKCDGVLCDGIGVTYAGHILGYKKLERLSFDSTSVAPIVFEVCSKENFSIYIIGGKEG